MIEIVIVIEIIEGVDSVIEDHRLQDLVMDTPMISVVTFMDAVRGWHVPHEQMKTIILDSLLLLKLAIH